MRQDGRGVVAQGEVDRERPMGSLAKLVWLDLEGARWEADGRRFRCTGNWQGHPCWLKSGHGEVDLAGALRESCNLAFLAWGRESLQRWARESGRSAALAKLRSAFAPFLGDRGEPLESWPALGTLWVGDGQLLRTSPRAFMAWLADPSRQELRSRCARILGDGAGGWVKSGTAAMPGREGLTAAWAAGAGPAGMLVLYLPVGRGKIEGVARFSALQGEAQAAAAPNWSGNPDAQALLEDGIQGALRSSEAFGTWPGGPWEIHLHEEAGSFERATGAPPFRAAAWVGATLHLRPWQQLKRRDLGALLRHELTHRRLETLRLRPWEEEARCLWAEGHTKVAEAWPDPPDPATQDALDAALRRGTTRRQAWAYAWLRAWLARASLPPLPIRR